METMTDIHLEVEPLTCAIGAELKGVNLNADIGCGFHDGLRYVG